MDLEYKKQNSWKVLDDSQLEELETLSKDYMNFLDKAKTERLATDEIIRRAKDHGFLDLNEQEEIKAGDKLYQINHNKSLALFVIGEDDLENGMNIVGSHIDSPRLDLKPNPMYEEGEMAYFKTHYYGGVKKYHWTNMPLALCGVAYDKDGNKIEINIGNNEDEPVFYISELLIHLSKDLSQKKAYEVIEAEQLNIIIGSKPLEEEKENPIKKHILKLINEKYNLKEEDFLIAEIEAVPAQNAREVGFDRSMIAAHGHDDRVCSFASLSAILKIDNPKKTTVSLFMDKEEIGSTGNTGMESQFFENAVMEVLDKKEGFDYLKFKRSLSNSKVLSADVVCAYDPNFKDAYEITNTALVSHGVTIAKYTGSGGKGGSNDANSEYLNEVRNAFNKDKVNWQVGELGKTDQGGGGTIAYILAKYGMQVVDCGTQMLSMHAPVELLSKTDFYETYRAYKSFFKNI
ncbi:MAG: aminopeptidase [Tissierellia bacterium]|nr:aminopeptidase [Tissierellia bacterium]